MNASLSWSIQLITWQKLQLAITTSINTIRIKLLKPKKLIPYPIGAINSPSPKLLARMKLAVFLEEGVKPLSEGRAMQNEKMDEVKVPIRNEPTMHMAT